MTRHRERAGSHDPDRWGEAATSRPLDAALNPGNSGGPLITVSDAAVVGLVDLGNEAAEGTAFAVSSQVAAPLLDAWATAPQPAELSDCAEQPADTSGTGSEIPPGDAAVIYVTSLDHVLTTFSAGARSALSDLINAVNSGSISRTEADATMDAIIEERRAFLGETNSVTPAPQFEHAQSVLRQSLQVHRRRRSDPPVDEAKLAGDEAAAAKYWSDQQALSAKASQLKAQFLAEYNALRKELLGLPPLDIHYDTDRPQPVGTFRGFDPGAAPGNARRARPCR